MRARLTSIANTCGCLVSRPVETLTACARQPVAEVGTRDTRILLSIPLSIHPDIIRLPGSATTADHAIRQRFTDFLPDFSLPFGRLISVRSEVQLLPGP
jgi:hypothetical protein